MSETTLIELESAPESVQNILTKIPESNFEILSASNEVDELAGAYVHEGAIGMNMFADALHIAFATVSRVDVLVSWNFKHIVNLNRIHKYNSVNVKMGYPMLEIRTPREIMENE